MKQKHKHGKDAGAEVLIPDLPEEIYPIKFHLIDAESVKKDYLHLKVKQGPLVLMQMAGRRSWHQISLVTAQRIYLKRSPRSYRNFVQQEPIGINRGISSAEINTVEQETWTSTNWNWRGFASYS